MKVAELISCLEQMPQDAEVLYVWDGVARSGADFVWFSKGGEVEGGAHGH